jgi:hypothetical protein
MPPRRGERVLMLAVLEARDLKLLRDLDLKELRRIDRLQKKVDCHLAHIYQEGDMCLGPGRIGRGGGWRYSRYPVRGLGAVVRAKSNFTRLDGSEELWPASIGPLKLRREPFPCVTHFAVGLVDLHEVEVVVNVLKHDRTLKALNAEPFHENVNIGLGRAFLARHILRGVEVDPGIPGVLVLVEIRLRANRWKHLNLRKRVEVPHRKSSVLT